MVYAGSVHFWNCIEEHFSLDVPKYIKNIFAVTGYDNALVIRSLDDEALSEIEEFVRNHSDSISPEDEDKKQYYHVYHNHPSKFKFVEGHKVLIRLIVAYVTTTIIEKGTKNGFLFFNTPNFIARPESGTSTTSENLIAELYNLESRKRRIRNILGTTTPAVKIPRT